jgi:outer membrane protein assembly factor BamD (BamD/ComL family)
MGKALLLGESVSEGKSWLDRLLADYPKSEYAKEAKALLAENDPAAANGRKGKR